MKMFPRPEIQRMASVFGMFELNVHAPFYDKINKTLSLDNEEFYNGYVHNETLKKRMEFIDSLVNHHDDLFSLGCFSLIERSEERRVGKEWVSGCISRCGP